MSVTRSGEQRIAAAFAAAPADGRRAALMPFVMGGFPTLDASRQIAEACADAGADLIEALGIPCADASADGPTIRVAGAAALRAGATVGGVLDVARAIAPRIPVVIMCYAQIVLTHGVARFAHDLRHAGVSGLIVADMSPSDTAATLDACDAAGVALIPLIAPATPDDLVARVGARARGFVYTVSVTGPTGERPTLSDRAGSLVARAKAHSAVPVALGFGISTPAHAAQAAAAGADGVIVGSRLVRTVSEAADPPAAVRQLIAQFSAALRHRPPEAAAPATLRRAA